MIVRLRRQEIMMRSRSWFLRRAEIAVRLVFWRSIAVDMFDLRVAHEARHVEYGTAVAVRRRVGGSEFGVRSGAVKREEVAGVQLSRAIQLLL